MMKYIKITVYVLVISLFIGSYILYDRNQSLNKEISVVMPNQKAFIAENSFLKE